MNQTPEQKLANAIEHLRTKGKYLIDKQCKFSPMRSDRFKPVTLRGK